VSAVRESVVIAASAERVWDLVMDPRRLEEWVTTHDRLEEPPEGPLASGSSFTQRLKLAGAPFTVRWTVTECTRPRLARWEGEGPGGARARVSYELGEGEEGTRFDYENSFELPGGMLGRVAGKALAAAGSESEARRSLQNLKRVLESGA
jgi:carbon monoxide dehydrogenase subunit G